MTNTTNADLIAELREQWEHELHFETGELFRQAAAGLEALQAEVERLKAACDKFSESELLHQAQPELVSLSDVELNLMAHKDCSDDWNSLACKRSWLDGYVIGAKAVNNIKQGGQHD